MIEDQSPLAIAEFLMAYCIRIFCCSGLSLMMLDSKISEGSFMSCQWLYIFNQLLISELNQMEQEVDGLNRSSNQLIKESHFSNNYDQEHPGYQNRVRHVYLEEENVYGRFSAFLLLKDKLHSQIDSSGASALAHMCSHNSPYIPLYLSTLKHGDPILNRPTNLGHTPLDIAGMYCKREYVELLKAKGAIDNGRVDHWAIQGGNIANWSGSIDVKKKQLIAWAAYNNLPEVLQKYAEAGADMDEPDRNGNTPIDMAVLNKNYQSVEVLARLGLRPKKNLIESSESPFLLNLFKTLDQSATHKVTIKSLKLSLIPLLLLSEFLVVDYPNVYLLLLSLIGWIYLIVLKPKEDSKERPTSFFSDLLNREINYSSNHKIYVLLILLLVLSGIDSLIGLQVDSMAHALYYWVLFSFTFIFTINLIILFYGIFTNTTPNELLRSHQNPQLWKKIDYVIHRNILTRVYKNQNKKDIQSNIQAYLNS